MELRFKESALADVRSFVFHYEDAFLELYSDSGLWSEEIILEGVRGNAKQLFVDVYDAVAKHLEHRLVLGRKRARRGWHELSFHVGSRLIIVYYSENRKADVRWVESISIDRKPIIF
ncbi:MAG: hypothetical protein AAB899_01330 [Patescibacteria group bacterium]